jgi:hypothetical protein
MKRIYLAAFLLFPVLTVILGSPVVSRPAGLTPENIIKENIRLRSPGLGAKHEDEDSDSGAFLALVIQTCEFVRRRLDTHDSGFRNHRYGNPSDQKVGDA